MYSYFSVEDIRRAFLKLYEDKKFTSVNREGSMTSLVGNRTIEIVNASFVADQDAIFGKVNEDYVRRETEWYNSMSLNVNDIPGGPPAIWKAVADRDGFINSNYGWCVYSGENLSGNSGPGYEGQFDKVVQELRMNPESRRAVIIYTRPSMWFDYKKNGRSDFCCTSTVQYLVRDGQVHAVVQMRSNDAVLGYKNDRHWQQHVLNKVAAELSAPVGNIYWTVGSLHVYERHFYLLDQARSGEQS
jgi:thymidylate synthase